MRGWLLVLAVLLAGCQSNKPWLSADYRPPQVTREDAMTLAQWLLRGTGELPPTLKGDREGRVVVVTVRGDATQVLVGRGHGLVPACLDAIAQARKPYQPLVRVDLVASARPVAYNPSGKVELPGGLEGLAGLTPGLVWTPQQLFPTGVPGDPMLAYRAICAAAEPGQVYPVLRGHRLVTRTLSADELRESARRAGDYLVRSVKPDGRMAYEYDPGLDRENKGYNMLRHAGALWSLYRLEALGSDPARAEAARRAERYLLRCLQPDPRDPEALVCVDGASAKLGGNALALLALVEGMQVRGDRAHLAEARRLARWIVQSQDSTGAFLRHSESYPGGVPKRFVSEYYPGEAVLALTRLYELEGDGVWLAAARSGAHKLIEQQSGRRPPHDHWLLLAMERLDRLEPDPLYLEHSRHLTRVILAAQHVDPPTDDWLGGFYTPPRTGPTAIRLEGLSAASMLMRRHGEDATAALTGCRLAARFLRQLQFDAASTLYSPNPERCRGGLPRGLSEPVIRIDNPQHSLCGWLQLEQLERELEPAEKTP